MRIGILAGLHHPVSAPFAGGLERHSHDLATGLLRRGHDVVVFGADDADPSLPVTAIRDQSRPLRLSDRARGDVSMVSDRFLDEHHSYAGLMRSLDRYGLDVLHVNSTHYLPVTMCRDVATPMTLTLHSPPTPWLESAFLHAGDDRPLIVAVSMAVAAMWAPTLTVDRVVRNGVDLDRWSPRGARPHGGAVWTGRITPEKGTVEAIEAAHRARLPLRVAGPIGDVGYAEAVFAALAPADAYLGHLGDDQLVAEVRDAAVQLVTPMWDEPYGLVAAEALACGTPVAGFRRGGLEEIVDRGSGLLVDGGDVAALGRAIPTAARFDRGACRRRAVTVADHDRMVDEYVAAFAAATSSRRLAA